MGRKLGDWGREASQGGADAGDWEEDRELQEALQRSMRDQAPPGGAAVRAGTCSLTVAQDCSGCAWCRQRHWRLLACACHGQRQTRRLPSCMAAACAGRQASSSSSDLVWEEPGAAAASQPARADANGAGPSTAPAGRKQDAPGPVQDAAQPAKDDTDAQPPPAKRLKLPSFRPPRLSPVPAAPAASAAPPGPASSPAKASALSHAEARQAPTVPESSAQPAAAQLGGAAAAASAQEQPASPHSGGKAGPGSRSAVQQQDRPAPSPFKQPAAQQQATGSLLLPADSGEPAQAVQTSPAAGPGALPDR